MTHLEQYTRDLKATAKPDSQEILDAQRRFNEVIASTGTYFHIDKEKMYINNPRGDPLLIDNLGLRLSAMNYIRNRKMLFQGEPGAGKTSSANIICTLMSGIPLYAVNYGQINCDPFATKESTIARPDFGALMAHKEVAIFQQHAYMPFLTLDEMNRFNDSIQTIFLNGMEMNIWTYLKSVLITGKRPTFATINHPDSGNSPIIPPFADRFDLCLEKRTLPWNYQKDKERCMDLQEQFLYGEELSWEIIKYLSAVSGEEDRGVVTSNVDGFAQRFQRKLFEDGVPYLVKDEISSIRDIVGRIPFTDDSFTFALTLEREINYSQAYGEKRSCDEVSKKGIVADTCMDPNHLVSKVKTPLTNRRQSSLAEVSKWFAFFSGENTVRLEHVEAAAPYTLAHYMAPDADFAATIKGEERTDMFSMFAAKRIVEQASTHYKTDIRKVLNAVTGLKQLGAGKMTLEDLTDNGAVMSSMAALKQGGSPILRHVLKEIHDEVPESALRALGIYNPQWMAPRQRDPQEE